MVDLIHSQCQKVNKFLAPLNEEELETWTWVHCLLSGGQFDPFEKEDDQEQGGCTLASKFGALFLKSRCHFPISLPG